MFTGSLVAMATPMAPHGAIDEEALGRLVEFHIENGTDGIVAVGTTGESATLDVAEHSHVIKQVVGHVAGRIPVIAGTGANATAEAVSLTREAKALGADACLLVTPYYNKPTQEGLYQHYKTIAGAVDIPQILYNVPGRTACDMLPDTVERLSRVGNIIGIKEASGEIARVKEIIERCGEGFSLYSGEDWMGKDAILAGGRGVISVTANVAPALMHEMCAAALAGDREKADAADGRLQNLHAALFFESNPIPTKWALQEMGLIGPGIRLPLTPLSQSQHEPVRRAMLEAGVLDRAAVA